MPLRETLATQRTHALLLHGPRGVGQFEMALTLAQAWLCEDTALPGDDGPRPCGSCASCRLVQARYGAALQEAARELMISWVDWLAAERARELAGTGLQAAQASLAAVEKRVRAGDASKLDLSIAGAELAEQKTSRMAAYLGRMKDLGLPRE